MPMLINPYRFGAPPPPPVVAADRWRFVTLSSDRTALSLGELELATTIGGTNIAPTGTPQSTTPGGSVLSAPNLTDGSVTTFHAAPVQNNDRWALQVLFPIPELIAEFRLVARDSGSGWLEAPKAGFTQTSQDGGTTWRSVDLWFNDADWVAGETRTIATSSNVLSTGLGRNNARGWRCRITSVGGSVPAMVGDLAFAASPGGANICTGGVGFASSTSVFTPSRHPRLAFDGNAASRWNGSGSGPTGEWRLGYARQTPLGNAAEARITLSSNAGETAQAPLTGFFDYTEDWWEWTEVTAFTISSPITGSTYTFSL